MPAPTRRQAVAIELTDELVADARRGSEAALGRLYRSLAPQVLGYLRARGAFDPEGTTNDVFLTVLTRLPQLHGGANGLRSLTFSVAHARLVDDYRRRQRAPHLVEYEPAKDRRLVESAESGALARLDDQRVIDILAQLPDDQADVIGLRIVAGLSVAQVAVAMNRSEGAVKQLQRRALLKLREVLDPARVTR